MTRLCSRTYAPDRGRDFPYTDTMVSFGCFVYGCVVLRALSRTGAVDGLSLSAWSTSERPGVRRPGRDREGWPMDGSLAPALRGPGVWILGTGMLRDVGDYFEVGLL